MLSQLDLFVLVKLLTPTDDARVKTPDIQQARILDDQVVGNVSHAFRLGAATYPEDYLGPAREAIPSAAVVQQASVASAPERLRNVPRYAMHPNGENL